MSDNKEVVGPILGFVGGLTILIYGAFEVYLAEVASTISTLNGLPVLDVGGVVIAGILGIVFGLFIMVFSAVAGSYLEYGVGFGILVIVFSLLSLLSVGGGNGVGFLLGVLGGTFCIAFADEGYPSYEPARATPSEIVPTPVLPSSSPATAAAEGRLHRACLRCGKLSPITATVCPACGQKF